MKQLLANTAKICAVVVLAIGSVGAHAQIAENVAAKSPWGPADEIGTLNMMTHTPARGNAKERLFYSGDGVSIYTHIGTHIDALNHFGLNERRRS